MKVKYYKADDILVIKLSENLIDYAEENDWIIIHYDKKKGPVRIEILDASRFLKATGKALPPSIKKQFFPSLSA